MKKTLLSLLLFITVMSSHSQNVGINTDGSAPDNSAMLDVKSTTSGVLIPRMTIAQRDAIVNPAPGLMVFCTDCGPCGAISVFLSSTWLNYSIWLPLPASGNHVASRTQIVWNWLPVPDATGYKWNTTNDYSTATDMGTATTTTETGLTCDSTYNRYVWAYKTCAISMVLTLTKSTSICFNCGDSVSVTHLAAGGVAPINKSTKYGTVTNVPGEETKCWITKNLGATQQATAVSDATEASAGWYWQFNRKQGFKHDGATLTPGWTITAISENSDWLPTNDPCRLELGTNWRLPTNTEWFNVDNIGGWSNWNGPWGSVLKMHAAGYLDNTNGSIASRGAAGSYWSNTQYSTDNGWRLGFGSTGSQTSNVGKAYGFSIRCIR